MGIDLKKIVCVSEPLFWESVQFYVTLVVVVGLAFFLRGFIVRNLIRVFTLDRQQNFIRRGLEAFAGPLEFAFVGFVALFALKVIPGRIKDLFLVNVFWTLIMLSFFWSLFQATNTYSGNLKKVYDAFDKDLSKELSSLITNVLRVLLALMGLFTILDLWGINVSALMGGVGIMTAAIGFASQDTIKNIFGSISVLLDQTFSIGDRVAIEGVEGIVEEIGLRSTAIRQFDQSLIMIPNANIVNAPIINYTRARSRMIKFFLYFEADCDSKALKNFVNDLKEYIPQHPLYNADIPLIPLLVFVDEVTVEGIKVYVRFFTNKKDFESASKAKQDTIHHAKELAEKYKLTFFQMNLG